MASMPTRASYLLLLSQDGDVIAFGADNLGFDVSFLLVGNPAVLLAVERLILLFLQLLFVRSQVLVVGVVWRNRRHAGGGSAQHATRLGVAEERLLQVQVRDETSQSKNQSINQSINQGLPK